MGFLSTVASAAMAVGAPLVYVDQMLSIKRKRDSSGFSMDVSAVLLFANITRCFYWLGERFELALLIQSLLMILMQLILLYLCVLYRPVYYSASVLPSDEEPLPSVDLAATADAEDAIEPRPSTTHRPFAFWQWLEYGKYLEVLAAYVMIMFVLYLVLGGMGWYIQLLGIFALGMESTLPIPQLISNFRRKSLEGFRLSVLAGWLFGDAFKAVYFFLQPNNSVWFKVSACFLLSVDIAVAVQAFLYRHNAPVGALNLDAGSTRQEEEGLVHEGPDFQLGEDD